MLSGAKAGKSCRSRRELSTECLLFTCKIRLRYSRERAVKRLLIPTCQPPTRGRKYRSAYSVHTSAVMPKQAVQWKWRVDVRSGRDSSTSGWSPCVSGSNSAAGNMSKLFFICTVKPRGHPGGALLRASGGDRDSEYAEKERSSPGLFVWTKYDSTGRGVIFRPACLPTLSSCEVFQK